MQDSLQNHVILLRHTVPAAALKCRPEQLLLENALDQIEVAEILQAPYAGEPFPGHGSINHSLRQLDVIYAQEKADWRGALEFMKGVYVIHDCTSGKAYVGSARRHGHLDALEAVR